MDYEKKYKEALERARVWKEKSGMPKNKQGILDDIFPELKESEDEKIRKELITWLKNSEGQTLPIDRYNAAIAWLEKQGTSYTKRDVDDAYVEGMASAKYELKKQSEQKPTDEEMKELLQTEYEKGRADAIAEMQNPAWSEEDEKCLENAIMYCEWARDKAPDLYCYETSEKSINWLKFLKGRVQPKQEWSKEDIRNIENIDSVLFYDKDLPEDICMRLRNWLKSLRDRVQLQSKQEWSEEDERTYKSIIYSFAHNYPLTIQQQDFVKSLRPQNKWKPSDKQLKALKNAIHLNPFENPSDSILWGLYEQLKKLK